MTGAAVDLPVRDIVSKELLDMGTNYAIFASVATNKIEPI
jgi:D-alanyl-D-alanine dipeptidase